MNFAEGFLVDCFHLSTNLVFSVLFSLSICFFSLGFFFYHIWHSVLYFFHLSHCLLLSCHFGNYHFKLFICFFPLHQTTLRFKCCPFPLYLSPCEDLEGVQQVRQFLAFYIINYSIKCQKWRLKKRPAIFPRF